MYQILTCLTQEKTRLQTHIMYDCRLSYSQLKEYRDYLAKNNLIKVIDSALAITPEGRELLGKLDKVFSVKLSLS